MNNSHLKYFKTLAEIKSYTRAAQELGIAQSTLSVAIRNLEKELGFELFHHDKKGVQLTPEGETIYIYVKGSIDLLEKGIEKAKGSIAAANRILSMGVVYSCQNKAWSQLIHSLRASLNYDIDIQIKQSTTKHILKDVRSGVMDLGFAGKLEGYEDLFFKPLWSSSLVAAVRKSHPLANRDFILKKELEGYRVATYADDGPMGAELRSAFKGCDLDIVHRQYDEISLCSLALANPDQLSLVCNTWLAKAFADDLAFVPIAGIPDAFHWVYLVYRDEEAMSLPGKELLRIIDEQQLDKQDTLERA